jgi:hypothetical protein
MPLVPTPLENAIVAALTRLDSLPPNTDKRVVIRQLSSELATAITAHIKTATVVGSAPITATLQ